MEHTKNILCSDCGKELKTFTEIYNKICRSCQQRKLMMKESYIPVNQMSEGELEAYRKRQAYNKIDAVRLRLRREFYVNDYKNRPELLDMIKSHKHLSDTDLFNLVNLNFRLECSKPITQEAVTLLRNGIDEAEKTLYPRRFKSTTKKSTKKEKEKKSATRGRTSIYLTDYDKQIIKTLSTKDMTVREIYDVVKNMTTNENFDFHHLRSYIYGNGIAFKRITNEERAELISKAIYKKSEKNKTEEQHSTDDFKIPVEQIIENVNVTDDNTETLNETRCENDTNDRMTNIETEVRTVLKTKYEELGCNVEREFTTEDYIQMLDNLIYLAENSENIAEARSDQWNIMNGYVEDCLHTCELTVSLPGDTYLQDKIHIIRDLRRKQYYDCQDMNILGPLVKSFDLEKLKFALSGLKNIQSQRANLHYVPKVDTSLIPKYDWASDGSEYIKKSEPIITYNLNDKFKTMKPNKEELETFRVSCKISGGGRGVFRDWHRDYSALNKDIALSYGITYLKKLQASRKGMIYTDLEVHKINR